MALSTKGATQRRGTTKRWLQRLGRAIKRWLHWLVNFAIAVQAGVILLPLLRSWPEGIHAFMRQLQEWQQESLIFTLSVVISLALFKLFSPRLRHVRYAVTHPPTWLAWLAGFAILWVIDIKCSLSRHGYEASNREWIQFGLVPIGLVWCYRWITAPPSKTRTGDLHPVSGKLPTDWPAIEAWLQSDAPADLDFLGNYAVAERIKAMLDSGKRSVGIVGPFGTGKTSIVNWMVDLVDAAPRGQRPTLLFSEHSCWGFEESDSSIHAMLADAIATVERRIDTFHVSSLPESYRQTFSAGGEWFDNVSKLVFGKRDPIDQFRSLSELLGDIGAKVVFIIEDLDRNDSRSFDIQEVLAFLQQLKAFPNLAFVLTGGLKSPARIDFAKLCDHIEYLKTVDLHMPSELVQRVRERCLDTNAYSHDSLVSSERPNVWHPFLGGFMRDLEELSVLEAFALLLNTPRSLRHVLGRTLLAWRRLYGEIDLDHLLAVNILRFAAPECFQFLARRWDRLRTPPSSDSHSGADRIQQIRRDVDGDWMQTIQNAEWNPTAARAVMQFLLPAAEAWLVAGSRPPFMSGVPQGIGRERYWRRAVSEAIDPQDVPDQIVIRDMKQWNQSPSLECPLIIGLCESSAYSDVWEDFAASYLKEDSSRILTLCEHVLTKICQEYGPAASGDSQGVSAVRRYAVKWVEKNDSSRRWLKDRIGDAALMSIELVNSLWHDWGAGYSSILKTEDQDSVRGFVVQVLRERLTDGEALSRIMHLTYPYVLFQLVFDPGDHVQSHTGVEHWNWLGPIMLDSIRRGDATVAVAVCSLIAARESGPRRDPPAVDSSLLLGFFGDDAQSAVDAISDLTDRVDIKEKTFVIAIVHSARTALAGANGGAAEN